jgi:L-alanine-DL-glutamate epimerase-like enolase superfamily enzyme
MDNTAVWDAMRRTVRNQGLPGIAAASIAAVDNALWDLKARLLNVPLSVLLGRARDAIDVYGSGGFTSYSDARMRDQFARWAELGIRMMKMKVGQDPARDPARVRTARAAIGPDRALFVDANGAYSRKQALAFAELFAAESQVSWFEEPVSSDDLDGLHLLVERAPAGVDIAAGEYGYELHYFRRMLQAGAVDVLQADASRCCGISGFLRVSALCESFGLPLSAHTAPSLHGHLCCAATPARHVEYFHDHARIEQMLFDGALVPVRGVLTPDLSRPGIGLELKTADAAPYQV